MRMIDAKWNKTSRLFHFASTLTTQNEVEISNWYNYYIISKRVATDPISGFWEGGRVCEQTICYQVAAIVVPFNLIYNTTMFWKKWILTLFSRPPRRCIPNPFNLICNITMFWKSWILTFWSHPLSPPRGSDPGLWLKTGLICFIFLYLCLHAKCQ